MKKKHSNPVPPEVQAEIDALAALPEDQINTDDIPEVRDWSGAKRGRFYRVAELRDDLTYLRLPKSRVGAIHELPLPGGNLTPYGIYGSVGNG